MAMISGRPEQKQCHVIGYRQVRDGVRNTTNYMLKLACVLLIVIMCSLDFFSFCLFLQSRPILSFVHNPTV